MLMKHQRLSLLAGIVVVAATISACARSNAGLTTEIKTKLAADTTVQAHDINVDSDKGVVTLRGAVDSQAAKERAIQIARETKGVVSVKDMLTVNDGGTAVGGAYGTTPGETTAAGLGAAAGGAIDDAAITMKVKTSLLADPVVKGLQIDVDTHAGVVTLTGDVASEAEKNQLIKLAKETEGVKDVQTNLRMGNG
jgi:hyperosmotically inducible protein